MRFVIYRLEAYTAVTIISPKSRAIREAVLSELGRGVTMYKGYGGRSEEAQDIVYCVVTGLEIGKVKELATSIDPAAFITYHPLAHAQGGVLKRTGLH